MKVRLAPLVARSPRFACARRAVALLVAGVVAATALDVMVQGCGGSRAIAQERPIPPERLRSGTTFLPPGLKAQGEDDFANPGMLWVVAGERLWSTPPAPDARACASCHGGDGTKMAGVAARYPAVDPRSGALFNLELRINDCRKRHQGTPALAWESPDLLGLTAFVAHQSRGTPLAVAIDGPARAYFETGQSFFTTRQGQLNLSCAQCHDDLDGRRLRGDVISQGHPTGFPIYRIDWQNAGSLQRRLRACSLGVRAQVLDFGAPEYLALELYLAWRAGGLPIETPALRK